MRKGKCQQKAKEKKLTPAYIKLHVPIYYSCSAKKRSASIPAIQPDPAAVTAWR